VRYGAVRLIGHNPARKCDANGAGLDAVFGGGCYPPGGRKRMNLVRGLLHLWIVVSVIWFCVVGFVVYALWPQDPGPGDFRARPTILFRRQRILASISFSLEPA